MKYLKLTECDAENLVAWACSQCREFSKLTDYKVI